MIEKQPSKNARVQNKKKTSTGKQNRDEVLVNKKKKKLCQNKKGRKHDRHKQLLKTRMQ